jgi:outer membrane phospholipase A
MKIGNTDLNKIIEHMDEAMWMLKNKNEPKASANEKMDVEMAKAMANLGKVAVEGYKVKAQALAIMSKADNPATTKQLLLDSGIANDESK